MKNTKTILTWLLAGMAIHAGPGWSAGATEGGEAQVQPGSFGDELASGFYSRVNILGFGVTQSVKSSPSNPGNALNLWEYQAVLNPRVDLNLDYHRWSFGLKPRAELRREHWANGTQSADEKTSSEAFLNEGFVRFRPFDQLLLSYGRENLQWGPSIILSSSNPFNRDNGRNNPRLELPGLDYTRVVLIPNSSFTVSAIANTGAGRLNKGQDLQNFNNVITAQGGQVEPFRRTYAIKLDYTGEDSYFSLIPSYKEQGEHRLGFVGGWNATDALLLYVEGSAHRHADAQGQVGASYTFESGPIVNVEYFRDNNGCVDKTMVECFQTGEVNTGDILFRRKYVAFQYTDNDLTADLSMNLRYIRGLDDDSGRLVGIFEYELGKHVQLYLIGNRFIGGTTSEFGSLLKSSVFVGAGYTF